MQTTFPLATEETLPIACNLNALDAQCRAEHIPLAYDLLVNATLERQDLPSGFAFRYDADQYPRLVEFIANERLCCPFFNFVLEIAPGQGPIWLRITGGDGVKEFLQSQILEN